jgi:putative hemolysin
MKNPTWQELATIGSVHEKKDARARADTRAQPSYSISFATSEAEVAEAQRLRYKVFAEEMGAKLASAPEAGEPGYDIDEFDAHCEHLLVREETEGKVVGAYRLLPPDNARRIGRLYSESEFDLSRLDHLRPRILEVGRSCVHWEHRNGVVIMMLWAGVTRFAWRYGYDYSVGCASISLRDGGHMAANLYASLKPEDFVAPEYRVFPRLPLPVEKLRTDDVAPVAPLIKGYLRLGAKMGGAPAWDPDFNSADLFTFMDMNRMNPRYLKHMLG